MGVFLFKLSGSGTVEGAFHRAGSGHRSNECRPD
jgi:hypothetical protein